MDVLVVGFGSIGERHAAILSRAGHRVYVVSRRSDVPFTRFPDLHAALAGVTPHYVVISTATGAHYQGLRDLVDAGFRGRVLVEKPLFGGAAGPLDGFDELDLYVGYNLRFHPVIEYLKHREDLDRAYSASIYVGSYLPNWRRRDYRRIASSCDAETGGVLRELSHELDYAMWLLGDWRSVSAHGGHVSHLEMPADDVFCLLMETQHCAAVNIQMNYFDRIGKREMVINYPHVTVHADMLGCSITTDQGNRRFNHRADDSYTRMHNAILRDAGGDVCSYACGRRVEQLLGACYQSMQTGRRIHV